MAVKKSEIYASLWKSCDALRGGMDASQYKDYILVLLFVKYVSDRFGSDPEAPILVPKGGSFADLLALKGDKNIGEGIDKVVARLAEENGLRGVIDAATFNDPDKLGKGQEMVDRLSNLVSIFSRQELDFRKNRADGDDLLGDAYEYLMRHFATESGKSKGQFYTPAEVSRIMAKVIGAGQATRRDQTAYDPACGSGSLLLKVRDEAPNGLTLYGQEKDVATTALAKMNMVLHGAPSAIHDIVNGNTLAAPHTFDAKSGLKTFDFVVANPPFSDKAWTTGVDLANDPYNRFWLGTPPAKNGDYAYLLHILASMKSTGQAAVVMPHGVLFRGNAEGEIRRNIVQRGYIKGIISLPANLFYGTGIPACLVVLDKKDAAARKGVFMIDASKGFVKDGNKNRLREQDIHRIVDAFTRQVEVERYARLVPMAEIEKNDFNLNIPRYIDSSDPEDLHDIEAHLKGGIPERDIDALADYWCVAPSLRGDLFGPGDRPGYASARVAPAEVRRTILEHAEFRTFAARVDKAFAGWCGAHEERLKSIAKGDDPKALIAEMSEDLLTRFAKLPLVDPYDVYQHLMAYWAGVMKDDVYILVEEGWEAARALRDLVKNSEGKFTEEPDIVLGAGRSARRLKSDLIPPALIVARFFAKQQAAIDELQAEADAAARAIEEMEEEHGGEDGLLADAKNDKDKLTAASVRERLASRNGAADDEERDALRKCLDLFAAEKTASDRVRAAQAALDAAVVATYAKLTEAEIKALLVADKWLATLHANITGELDRVSQRLTGRVKQLEERYAAPMPKLSADVEALSAKVDEQLKRMGFAWR